MADIPDSLKISRRVRNTIAPGDTQSFSGYSNTFYVIETTGTLRIKTDTGISANYDVNQGVRTYQGNPFSKLEVSNETADLITFDIFYGFGEFIDNSGKSVTVTQNDPNFASPAIIDSTPKTDNASAIVELLPYDAQRGEVWLWTDESANLAWWGESAARLASPQEFQKIGLNLDGFTKLKTKSAIHVYALAGVKIGAIVFKD